MCAVFLKHLQARDKVGDAERSFAVLSMHGKVYGRWLPLALANDRSDLRAIVDSCLFKMIENIDAKWQKCINVDLGINPNRYRGVVP